MKDIINANEKKGVKMRAYRVNSNRKWEQEEKEMQQKSLKKNKNCIPTDADARHPFVSSSASSNLGTAAATSQDHALRAKDTSFSSS